MKVTAVEIREITPPQEIQTAMTRQMSAERSRRAIIIEADGKRDAAVRVAEGQKQATILEAEGARQAAILRAEGYAQALAQISTVASHLDSQTMSLQYLEALKVLGTSPSTKLVVPAEFTSLLRPLIEHTNAAQRATDEVTVASGTSVATGAIGAPPTPYQAPLQPNALYCLSSGHDALGPPPRR